MRHTATSRREFLATSAALLTAAASPMASARVGTTYDDHVDGIRILPGAWRPHYPWEHIAWVSPPWPSQDYIWMDFPEAIFTSQGLIYLSHVNPPIDTVYESLPAVPWVQHEHGVSFERALPSKISFGGNLTKEGDTSVSLELHIHNGSSEPLNNISLQTCAFLRGIKEFGDYTRENKYVHTPDQGWVTMEAAKQLPKGDQPFRVGWRTSGNPIADVPVVVMVSNQADRLVAFTWHESTLSMVSNPKHPCFHADPKFPDLASGEGASVKGKLFFFEGPLRDFDISLMG